MEPKFISAKSSLPESGTIVEVKVRRKSCSCGGYERRECYYDTGVFSGIKNSKYVDYWRISPANDLIKELEERKCVIAKDCRQCEN